MGWAGNQRAKPHWRCPRCREEGDPRSCTCMRQIGAGMQRAFDELGLGHVAHARTELAGAMHIAELLGLDAGHERRAA